MDASYTLVGSKRNISRVRNVAPIDEATSSELTFCSQRGDRGLATISKTNAGVVLCDKTLGENLSAKAGQVLVLVENPRLTFMHLANRLRRSNFNYKHRISPLSFVSKLSNLGENCSVGNFTAIDDDCIVGMNTVIGDRVSLKNCIIGDNCIIQSGVSIGEDGFAYERNDLLELESFPHFGKVIIGNNVEVNANCNISRGSLKNTIINDGTKIDALVHVAHNVSIGKNCSLTAGTVIGGSTSIGDTCWLGLNCTLKHKIKLGNKVIVGSGASVINDVPNEDIVAGVPAKSIKHKVISDQLFLMAGQKPIGTFKTRNLLHY
jgi:UDP-3-O-[3-hydroxymyristoyl] glucosamine N-acyltransferase